MCSFFSLNLVMASCQQDSERGNALAAQGKFEEAIIAYDLAIKYQPDLAERPITTKGLL